MTVEELVERYLSTRIGVKPNTKANYNFVKNLMKKEDFYYKKIGDVKTSDAKLFLIKLQQDGKRYSTVKTVRGVLRPAFQMAVDDDVLHKNPFGFELAGVVVNDSVTREALTRDQMRKFLKFVHDDNVYCKYCNSVQREHDKKLNNGLPILHMIPPYRDYGRYFCIMAEKGGTM